jgi:hypothetical protein
MPPSPKALNRISSGATWVLLKKSKGRGTRNLAVKTFHAWLDNEGKKGYACTVLVWIPVATVIRLIGNPV